MDLLPLSEFENYYHIIGSLSLTVFLIVIFLNVIAWLAIRLKPSLLTLDSHKKHPTLVTPNVPKKQLAQWWDLNEKQYDELMEELKAFNDVANLYEAFTEFKHGAFSGEYFNISPHGFRHVSNQGPWPPDPSFYNILFFGGSTAIQPGPDWISVASNLQKYLNKYSVTSKLVRVYNFGRGAYFSTQEKIFFQQIMMKNNSMADMVIFLDGLNEFYFYEGVPSTYMLFADALKECTARNAATYKNIHSADPKWMQLEDFISSLPAVRLAELLWRGIGGNKDAPIITYTQNITLDDNTISDILRRYHHNKRQIEGIAKAYSIHPVFVWQPVPTYKYDLSCHLAIKEAEHGLIGHERSGKGYEAMSELTKKTKIPDNFIWLADIQENSKEALYHDHVHYTAQFCKVIAKELCMILDERNLFGQN